MSLIRQFLSGLLPGKGGAKETVPEESFAARFHRFRLFLSAHMEAYSEIMSFEERLAGDAPIGMPFLRMCSARLTVSAMQCVLHLNTLGGGRYGRLNEPFARLRSEVQNILNGPKTMYTGPLVIPYADVAPEHADLVAPSLVKLWAAGEAHPEFMPKGFVVTAAGWQRYFNDPDLSDEVSRIMVISQDDPASYSEAGAAIRERLNHSFELPEDLRDAVRQALPPLGNGLAGEGKVLLIRCLPVLPEHAALVMPEQVLRSPLTPEAVLDAVRKSLGTAFQARAIIYRLKRGIRNSTLPLCLSLTLLPVVQARGSCHRKLESAGGNELVLHVRRSFTTPEQVPSQASEVGARLAPAMRGHVLECCHKALACLADAPVRGNRHEIYWAASEQGDFYLLGANALPDPEPVPEQNREALRALCREHGPGLDGRLPPALAARLGDMRQEAGTAGRDQEPLDAPPALRERDKPDAWPGFPLCGGLCAYPGVAEGKAVLVRNFADALNFPLGGVLVLGTAGPRWAFLLDFASAAVAGDGTGNGLFARTARRYGRPVILNLPEATGLLTEEQGVRLLAEEDGPSVVQEAPEALEPRELTACAIPDDAPDAFVDALSRTRHLLGAQGDLPSWMPGSDIAQMVRALAPLVVQLTLPDSESPDFRAENCRTFHDFVVYCHDHAVREMFLYGTSRKSSVAPAKQLVTDVPKQFWIINLDDGYYTEPKGPTVDLANITSLPMRALWAGFVHKPWGGPPQLNAKGFMSILYEATVNPNLDPAAQSSQYTEKNVFLIARRFCSMRCRFGFHFLSLDCLLSDRESERFIIFQFKGGAANLARRVRRVHFVAELLGQFDFASEITGDTLTARLENRDMDVMLAAMRVVGYLVMHTRQLDMIMGDEQALAERRFQMLEDMLELSGPEFDETER